MSSGLPNLFIVGAAKSGTSTLWHHLKGHPQVFMPQDELLKEPAFFTQLKTLPGLEAYLDIFASAKNQQRIVGEASTAYLTDPTSAGLIHDFNPRAKIIILLRNPADRAYSLYNWMVQEGYEYASSFKRALELEEKRKTKRIPNYWEPQYYWNYMYFSSGLYYEQVKRYIEFFGSSVLVLTFDGLVSDLNGTYQKVCRFLDIDLQPVQPRVMNPSKTVMLPALQFLLRKCNHRFLRMRRVHLKKDLSKKERDQLLRVGQLEKKPKKIDPALKNELMKRYAEDLNRLSELTKLDLSAWQTA